MSVIAARLHDQLVATTALVVVPALVRLLETVLTAGKSYYPHTACAC